ncbi:energy-coupling factor ABC transporter permease [Methanobrevibacter sp.]|uniref:energy-coupling factor ABC transporter permease n=1 Tax=Methanobrevibacter sp. TaxID=66852 RepID=UPI00386A5366
MHIPDGLIPFDQAMIYLIASLIILSYFSFKLSRKADMEKRLVLSGILTAVAVVATTITIPSPIGIPMHFFVIPLVVILLGPYNASLVSFLALLVQALGFGMGGVTTLGINVLDMGIILSVVVYAVYVLLVNVNEDLAIVISTMAGILAATMAQILILTFAKTTSFEVLLGSLLPYYLMIAVIEGVINVIIIKFISKTNRSILEIEKV